MIVQKNAHARLQLDPMASCRYSGQHGLKGTIVQQEGIQRWLQSLLQCGSSLGLDLHTAFLAQDALFKEMPSQARDQAPQATPARKVAARQPAETLVLRKVVPHAVLPGDTVAVPVEEIMVLDVSDNVAQRSPVVRCCLQSQIDEFSKRQGRAGRILPPVPPVLARAHAIGTDIVAWQLAGGSWGGGRSRAEPNLAIGTQLV